ncbi:unnamed protein product [Symbiodinium necroappetens]|uniref:Uncharacterized protein n=1 Tax=Symbiodinium necroappetens TaxID=1628268 RepID=A0A813BRP9_9DINO|nr:unnamed protein product [Symbiodinium necroappetens]
MGTQRAADEQKCPRGHETVDPEQRVELEVLFKMGQTAGSLNNVKERVSPSDMNFATEAMRLVAKMGSNFLEADGDDTELQMAVVGIGRTGVVVKTNVVALIHKLEGYGSGAQFIVAPTGGLKDTVEDGVPHDFWTDGMMTVEALVEHESSRKSEIVLARGST